MKKDSLKFYVFCLVVLSIVVLPSSKVSLFKFCDLNCAGTYFFYTGQIDYEIKDANVIKNGKQAIVSCDINDAFKIKTKINNVYGESICIESPSENLLNKIINLINGKIVKSEKVDNITLYYFFDAALPRYVVLGNDLINLQIAVSKSSICIGYPLILGSY